MAFHPHNRKEFEQLYIKHAAGLFFFARKFVDLQTAEDMVHDVFLKIASSDTVLLMWAEALVEKNDLSGAMAKVKEVRDRVGIPTMASSFSEKDKARNYVRDERRRELAGEGVNFFDEIRWRTLKETKFDTKFPQAVWGESTGGTVYQWIGNYYYTWPVPRSEIQMNPNLIRTPGWVY